MSLANYGAPGQFGSVAVNAGCGLRSLGSKRQQREGAGLRYTGRHKSVPFESGNDMSQVLKPELSAPAQARRGVASALDAWGLGPIRDDAILLTSELVTNAVIHAGTPIVLVVRHIQRGVRIEVNDDAPSLPERRYTDDGPPRQDGRGVWLLDQLADRWGVQRRPNDSKFVWFELDRR
jgi:anti-sigma regulatory factor (Ser/Thr protein kinase)